MLDCCLWKWKISKWWTKDCTYSYPSPLFFFHGKFQFMWLQMKDVFFFSVRSIMCLFFKEIHINFPFMFAFQLKVQYCYNKMQKKKLYTHTHTKTRRHVCTEWNIIENKAEEKLTMWNMLLSFYFVFLYFPFLCFALSFFIIITFFYLLFSRFLFSFNLKKNAKLEIVWDGSETPRRWMSVFCMRKMRKIVKRTHVILVQCTYVHNKNVTLHIIIVMIIII